MVVYEKDSSDQNVVRFEPPFDLRTRLRRGLSRRLIERTQAPLDTPPADAGYFSDDRCQHGGDMLRQALPADILHLHWVAHFIGYSEFFRRLPAGMPVVWTLHDMNPFTGGCHHAADCQNFCERCGDCPQLSSPSPRDFSNDVWKRKRRSYAHVYPGRFSIVTPSRWLSGKAKKSSLMGALPVNVIPYGLNTETFRPRDKTEARRQLGVPLDATVLLFVSQWLRDRNKGMPTLLAALERLKGNMSLLLLSIGRGELADCPVPHMPLGSVDDEERLAVAYNAADLFLIPSVQDNFPNTALEALASGLPSVGSRVGGVPEIVREGSTGSLADVGDADAFAGAIAQLLSSPERLHEMSMQCRRIAVEEYALEVQAKRYVEVYQSALEASRMVSIPVGS
jgi:glycosyltransferase involved in cell wall biosynthesis